MANCPNCGSGDLELVELLAGDARLVRCTACGHEWTRGEKPAAQPRPSVNPARRGDPSNVILFDSDDEGYLKWTSRYSTGYVINTTRPPAPSTLMLHAASCYHITTSDHRSSSKSWTGNDYSKVCSVRRGDLLAWARQRFGSDPARCQHCSP